MENSLPVSVSVEVQPPPDTSPSPMEPSSNQTVVIVPPSSTNGDAITADLLGRMTALEAENQALKDQIAATAAIAIQAEATAIEATSSPLNEPTTDVATLEVPGSSDAGPPAESEPEKPEPARRHRWI